MKHRSVKEMLNNPDTILAEHIADYAVYNTTENDSKKTYNIIELVIAYAISVKKDDL